MTFDHATLDLLRHNHPAWHLLRSDHAPLVASFLHRVFITPNMRLMAQADLAEMLEDELFALREQLGPDAFPRPAPRFRFVPRFRPVPRDGSGAERREITTGRTSRP